MKHAPILKPDPARAREGDPLVAVRWRRIGQRTSNYVHELIAADGPVVRRVSVNRAYLWAFPRYATRARDLACGFSDDHRGRGHFSEASWSSVRACKTREGVPGIKVVELADVKLCDLPGSGARTYVLSRRRQLAGSVSW